MVNQLNISMKDDHAIFYRREVSNMKNLRIKLMKPYDVQEFVNIASQYDFDIDLRRGSCYLDAKSFIGVLTQALEQEMLVICHGENEDFNRSIQKFAVA